MEKIMTVIDVVLINSCGCEIARETITEERGYDEIVSDWIVYPEDRIECKEVWAET